MPRNRDRDLLRRIGARLAEIRRQRGFTQEALAEAIGIEPVTLGRLETADRAVSLSTLAMAADVLQVSLADLLDIQKPVPAPELGGESAALVRLFASMSQKRRNLLLKLAKELAD